MRRRTFIKRTATGTAVLLVPGSVLQACSKEINRESLSDNFLNPPASARAHTWWHWMNGNISGEGITKDLEAMKDAGLGGFQIFQVGSGTPKGPIDFGSAEHAELLNHAVKEAERLGLEFNMHNCPGWTSSGGPWITPEYSMKQLVWTETFVTGGQTVEMNLKQPYAKLDYFDDVCVVAFPSLKGEEKPVKDLLTGVTTAEGPVNIDLLDQSDLEGGIEIIPDGNNAAYMLFEFAEPYTMRSVSLFASRSVTGGGPGGGNATDAILESSEDGTDFKTIYDFSSEAVRIDDTLTDCPESGIFDPVTARFFRLTFGSGVRVHDVNFSSSPRIYKWTGKANFRTISGKMAPGMKTSSVIPVRNFPVDEDMVIGQESVVDVSSSMNENGMLTWEAPEGNWTIMRIGCTSNGIENHPAPDGGSGLECDKFSKEAMEFHFSHFFGELLPALEAVTSSGMIAGAVIDSYEVGMQNWTKRMFEEFEQRAGYNMIRYMPAMTGRIIDSIDFTERFLWDLRRVQADMMADNYYGHLSELCHRHGMISFAESYSGGPYEEMQAGSRVDVPMGEFWAGSDQAISAVPSIKMAASVSHVNGGGIVATESFTGSPDQAKWQQYPFSLKAQGDWIYTLGVNRLIFHRFAHQPNIYAVPGMTMSRYGIHMDRTNTWFPVAGGWLDYLARCQYMLQQGLYAADVAYYTGMNAPMANPTVDSLNPALPGGYQFDTINAEAIMNRADIKNGRLVLPDGMNYKLLILRDDEKYYTPAFIRKLKELVEGGLYVYGAKPEGSAGLSGYPASNEEIRDLADDLWGDVDGITITERNAGKGKIFYGMPVEELLKRTELPTDFRYSSESGDAAIHYIHKKISDTDYYFVTNFRRRPENIVCTFAVKDRQPELWDPVSGSILQARMFSMNGNGVTMPLQLAPSGSVFVVFKEDSTNPACVSIMRAGNVIAGVEHYPEPAKGRYGDITDNFTIGMWIKPEMSMSLPVPGRSGGFGGGNPGYAIYPPAGSTAYGAGHAACGLTAARNGVVLYERESDDPSPVLVAEKPLAGWTHLAITYIKGVPAIYINGTLAAKGKASGRIVHPGLKEAFLSDGAGFYWGDMSMPELFDEVLDVTRIRQLASGVVPGPEDPLPAEIPVDSGILVWQPGEYTFEDSEGLRTSYVIEDAGRSVDIGPSWKVSFPPGLGAPDEISLDGLVSLNRHPDNGVRYFSGTAAYSITFTVTDDLIGEDKRLFLDLGRVEVIAQVIVNGKDMGLFWTRPYRIDINEVAKTGDNALEVRVTNLWPNRLIGDEQQPPENEYGDGMRGGGGIVTLPEWYINGKPKPAGGRITFTTWQHYTKNDPLLESGLIGPVRLMSAKVLKV